MRTGRLHSAQDRALQLLRLIPMYEASLQRPDLDLKSAVFLAERLVGFKAELVRMKEIIHHAQSSE